MNDLISKLRRFSRNKKIVILIVTDFFIAFVCWVVFGPPMSFMIASNFEMSLFRTISNNYLSFLIPFLFVFIFFYYSDFYRATMRSFNSKDSIISALIGSLIFGVFWSIVYLSQYELIRTGYLTTVILQAFLLSSVFYAFLQISRDIAGLIIYPNRQRFNGKPILIYGAGSAGNELYQALKVNPGIRVIGFFDDSTTLKGAEINNIKIYGKYGQIGRLSKNIPIWRYISLYQA